MNKTTWKDAAPEVRKVMFAGRSMDAALWAVFAGVAFFSLGNVYQFAVDHHTPREVAWLLAPIVDVALFAAISGDATLGRLGIVIKSKAPMVLRIFAGAATWLLNAWQSLGGFTGLENVDPAGVLLHSVPPVVLIILAETAPVYREAFAQAVEKALAALADTNDETTSASAQQQQQPASALAAGTVLSPPRPADPYRLSFTDGDRERPLDLIGTTPDSTGSTASYAVAGGWPTRLPEPRTESSTETPAGSTTTGTETTPVPSGSGTGTDRELTGSSRESDEKAPGSSENASADSPATGDDPGAEQSTGDDDRDELTPTERARAHWDTERAAGRVPSGAELDRVAGTKDYGRGLRRKWLADEAEAEGRLHAV